MDEFIKMAASQFGIGKDDATQATGGLLNLLKSEASELDFQSMLNQVPGAKNVLETFENKQQQASGGNGIFGAVKGFLGGNKGGTMQAAAGLLDGKAGSVAQIMGSLNKAGLKGDQAGSFVSMFMSFIKQKVGNDLFGNLMSKVPELTAMIGKR